MDLVLLMSEVSEYCEFLHGKQPGQKAKSKPPNRNIRLNIKWGNGTQHFQKKGNKLIRSKKIEYDIESLMTDWISRGAALRNKYSQIEIRLSNAKINHFFVLAIKSTLFWPSIPGRLYLFMLVEA